MSRVLHIIKATGISGAEKHLAVLLAGLRAAETDARLLVLVEERRPLDDYLALLHARDIPAERVFIRRHIDRRAVAELRGHLRTLRPALVHTHLFHADWHGLAAVRAESGPRPLLVSSRHNDDRFRRRALMRAAHRAWWALADGGIGISDALTRFCITVEGAPARTMTTIRYGLEPAERLDVNAARRALRTLIGVREPAKGQPAPIVFGTVGRLIEQKGIVYAIRAFAKLAGEVPGAHLVVVGDGPLRTALQAEAQMWDVAGRVHFLGWRTDAPQLMAGFDVLLMPSLWEGFGLVMLEAMAQRVPIIASAVSALPEIVVEGETGLLVPPGSSGHLAEAMRRLVNDAALRGHMGLMGEERLESTFTAARMVRETAAFYATLGL
jgi:glycosyltransferase involved in cell wall biosynthesis